MATAPQVTAAIDGVRSAAKRVVVDLSAATFLDSAAINCLIHCQSELDTRRVAFAVVSPPAGVVRKALEITNMVERLGVVDSRRDLEFSPRPRLLPLDRGRVRGARR